MKRFLAVAALVVVGAACGGDDRAAPESKTVAFLRAVPGAPSTEPSFVNELRTAGFVEGRNLTLLASDASIAFPDKAGAAAAIARWRRRGVDLVMALSTSGARAVATSAPDIPAIFISNDPTATGLVENEQRPAANLTGVTFRVPADRTLSIARRIVPQLTRVGLAYPAGDAAALANRDAVAAASEKLNLELVTEEFSSPDAVAAAIEALAAREVGALLLSTSPAAVQVLPATAEAAARHGLPVISNTTLAEFAVVSLSPDTAELGRQMARQAARLLSGADVASVPVEDPRRFILTVNVSAAEQLGISVPESLLREANEVVQ